MACPSSLSEAQLATCTDSIAGEIKNRYIDSHCHIDLVASATLEAEAEAEAKAKAKAKKANTAPTSSLTPCPIPTPPPDTTDPSTLSPWASFLKKTEMPHEYIGCIAIFCFADDSSSWGKWEEYISHNDPVVWGAVGIHPHQASKFTPAIQEQIMAAMSHPRIVAWGECGLDYFRLISSKDEQKSCFIEQIQCAVKCNKPLVVHCRDEYGSTDATADCYGILKQFLPSLDWKIHFHCWSQSVAETREAMELFPNSYFGFTGLVTTNRPGVRDAVDVVPLNRLLLETDGPFCAPNVKAKRPRVAHPGHIPTIAQWIADHKKVSLESLCDHALQNTITMYGLSI